MYVLELPVMGSSITRTLHTLPCITE